MRHGSPQPPTPPGRRAVIVNADDLGMSRAVTDGVLAAFDRGIVTSASLMVLRPDSERAATEARGRKRLALGLHFELGEWRRDGRHWVCIRPVVDLEDARAVTMEVERQLRRFRALTGQLPTHLDTHQHVHLKHAAIHSAVSRCGGRLGVPVRALDDRVGYCGRFFGQDGHGEPHEEWISLEGLAALLEGLPTGTTELACHPGLDGVVDPYGSEREVELRTLTDPRAPALLDETDISLQSFLTFQEV